MMPLVTFATGSVFVGLYFLAPLGSETFWALVLDRHLEGFAWQQGWRWVTAHFVHTNLNHLLWNLGAWVLLAGLIESRSRWQLVLASILGAAGVCLWFSYYNLTFSYYAGASGMLNALFVVVLNQSRGYLSNWVVAVIGLGAVAKIGFELFEQTSLVGNAAWPPTPAAHLAGFVAGLGLLCATWIVKQVSDSKISNP